MLNQTTEKTAEHQQRRHEDSTITSHVLQVLMMRNTDQEEGGETLGLSHLSSNELDTTMRNATSWSDSRRTSTASPALDDDDGQEYEESDDDDDGIMEIYSFLKAAIEISEGIPFEDDGDEPTVQLLRD